MGCRRSLRERSARYAHEFNYTIKVAFGSRATHHNLDVTLYNPVHDIKVVQAGDCRYAKQVGARPRERLHGLGESTVDALGPPRPAVLNCRAISRPFSFPKLENRDRLAIARRSLKDKSVTIVSVTRVLVSYVERHEKLDYLPNSNMWCKLGSLFLWGCVWYSPGWFFRGPNEFSCMVVLM